MVNRNVLGLVLAAALSQLATALPQLVSPASVGSSCTQPPRTWCPTLGDFGEGKGGCDGPIFYCDYPDYPDPESFSISLGDCAETEYGWVPSRRWTPYESLAYHISGDGTFSGQSA
ncbi:hypothetical protein QBC34DRAFT_374629 [Podospora aff. communis PSN243]|uniref:Uncharacterized protein n=1 Tax=Podospora aff. communis PSN243 TaxID=3040156 RepID=A0AAV9H386_9PEZI|nr:hypothetical protein QBC34DRAFT_374629 [Podospora aff. communis PSN243]